MQTYQTISGQTIDLTGTEAVKIAFLERLRTMAEADSGATHSEMTVLAYGTGNPILDPNVIPGRGAVTAAVLYTPAYRVMTDILFRKEMVEEGITVEELAKQFTLTLAETAERLGVHVSAVSQAIAAGRLGAWIKSGRPYIDPGSLSAFRLAPRGPKPRAGVKGGRASTRPLAFRAGTAGGKTLHVRFAGEPSGSGGALRSAGGGRIKAAEGVKAAEGLISPWRRVGVLTGSERRARFVVLTPSASADEETIAFGDFYVRGSFEVAEKINTTKAAKQAWQEFTPA